MEEKDYLYNTYQDIFFNFFLKLEEKDWLIWKNKVFVTLEFQALFH